MNLLNNLHQRIDKIQLEKNMIIKIVKWVELNSLIVSAFSNTHMLYKEDLTEYKCLCCNNNYQKKNFKKFDKNLKKRFFNTYKFYNHDINKFTSLLRKGV